MDTRYMYPTYLMQGTQYASYSRLLPLLPTLLHSYSTSSLHHLPTYITLITVFISFHFLFLFQLLRAHRDLSFPFLSSQT